MARKKSSPEDSSNRSNPRSNKSLAIRNMLKKMPSARASEVAVAVKKEYGHTVSRNMIYMVKTKANMRSDGRDTKRNSAGSKSPMTTPLLWVESIGMARKLLKATGSVANATALLKALDG